MRRLSTKKFAAYLVGGAVRDLILKIEPKDFDIVTDATPTQIKKIFLSSKIIGRRFQIVHVRQDKKIFELIGFLNLLRLKNIDIFYVLSDSWRTAFFAWISGANQRIGFDRYKKACNLCGKQISLIASIILCASLIIGVLAMTGLGIKLTSLIMSFSNNNVWLALLLTALACLILGMEVPTTAAYIICVTVAGPALIDMGLDILLVHLFVFWFALLSTITPPVCGTVFIAAGMVNENWVKVSITSMILGLGLYFLSLIHI